MRRRYTLSDMPELRAHLAARYAPRILTDTSVTVTHTVKSVGTHDKEGVGFKQVRRARKRAGRSARARCRLCFCMPALQALGALMALGWVALQSLAPPAAARACVQAAGELWSFSLTQHHVLTQYSGFGKVPCLCRAPVVRRQRSARGAARETHACPPLPRVQVGAMLSAAGPRHIYRINQTMNLLGLLGLNNKKDVEWWRPRPPCTPEHADPLLGVCTEYTGI